MDKQELPKLELIPFTCDRSSPYAAAAIKQRNKDNKILGAALKQLEEARKYDLRQVDEEKIARFLFRTAVNAQNAVLEDENETDFTELSLDSRIYWSNEAQKLLKELR